MKECERLGGRAKERCEEKPYRSKLKYKLKISLLLLLCDVGKCRLRQVWVVNMHCSVSISWMSALEIAINSGIFLLQKYIFLFLFIFLFFLAF